MTQVATSEKFDKSVTDKQRGAVRPAPTLSHPKYEAPLNTKKVHGWQPQRVRAS